MDELDAVLRDAEPADHVAVKTVLNEPDLPAVEIRLNDAAKRLLMSDPQKLADTLRFQADCLQRRAEG